jgi:hypothetical protein
VGDLEVEAPAEGGQHAARAGSKCEREDAARICASDGDVSPGLIRLLGNAVLNKVEARVPSVTGLVNLAECVTGFKIRVRTN